MPARNNAIQSCFNKPKVLTVNSRKSTITNAFVNAIVPFKKPTDNEIKKALKILGMNPSRPLRCVYCGDVASEWDHLHPLVKGGEPTYYISEIHNMVPSCGKCNQSKRNKEWEEWMKSDAPQSPFTRSIPNLKEKIARLKKYEKWGRPVKVNLKAISGQDLWERHWKHLKSIHDLLDKAQKVAREIKNKAEKSVS